MKVKNIRELNKLKREGEQQIFPRTIRIQVGTAPCGLAKGARGVVTTLQKELDKAGVDASVVQVGCIGMCYAEPTVEVTLPGKEPAVFGFVKKEKAREIIDVYIKRGELIDGIIPVSFKTIDD